VACLTPLPFPIITHAAFTCSNNLVQSNNKFFFTKDGQDVCQPVV
jgi:hypothetical protein